MEYLPVYIVTGICTGGVYALVALGVVVIYKATKVFNFAVGELVMLGGCFGISFTSSGLGIPWPLGILLALLVMGAMGALIQAGVLGRFVGKSSLTAMMVTAILTYFLLGVGVFGWKGQPQVFEEEFLPAGSLAIGPSDVPLDLMWSFLICMVLFGIFLWLFQYSKLGLGMRSTAEDGVLSQSKGVGVKWMHILAWVVGGLTAALGGILLGYRSGITPSLSLLGLKAFPVVFLGGLDSISGAIVGGLLIGVIEKLVGGYISTSWGMMVPFIVLLIVLIVRPEGILGTKRVERI